MVVELATEGEEEVVVVDEAPFERRLQSVDEPKMIFADTTISVFQFPKCSSSSESAGFVVEDSVLLFWSCTPRL